MDISTSKFTGFISFVALLFMLLVATGCSSSAGKCGILDKRFSCMSGYDAEGPFITFTKVPAGKFTVGRILLSEEDVEGSTGNCMTKAGNIISKGEMMRLDCPDKKGKIDLSIKVNHAEPGSYSPVSGETCLKKSNQWQCDTRAWFSYSR